jgi:hypothetical protein
MEIKIWHSAGINVAEIIADGILVAKTQHALDIMAECSAKECWKIILHEKNIVAGFFDLKTGIAGDILQKFSTYDAELAIVGDFSKFESRSLKDFIRESNKTGRISFVASREEALERLFQNKHDKYSGKDEIN